MMIDMMKTMFEGFKVNIDLEVAGTIVKTNAEYVAGSSVTLLEMDMEALLPTRPSSRRCRRSSAPTPRSPS